MPRIAEFSGDPVGHPGTPEESFGHAVGALRTRRGLSRAVVSTSGRISIPAISSMESGQRAPTPAAVRRVAQGLGLSGDRLWELWEGFREGADHDELERLWQELADSRLPERYSLVADASVHASVWSSEITIVQSPYVSSDHGEDHPTMGEMVFTTDTTSPPTGNRDEDIQRLARLLSVLPGDLMATALVQIQGLALLAERTGRRHDMTSD